MTKFDFGKYKKLENNNSRDSIDVDGEEIIDTKKDRSKCSKCDSDAGFRTTHFGVGDCFKHDIAYKTLGLYKGNGSFSEVLKDMEKSDSNVASIETQIRVHHSVLQVLIGQANDAKTEQEIRPVLLSEITRVSKQIALMAATQEKLELSRKSKADIKEDFVKQLVGAINTILRLHVSEQDVLNKVSADFDALILSHTSLQNNKKLTIGESNG